MKIDKLREEREFILDKLVNDEAARKILQIIGNKGLGPKEKFRLFEEVASELNSKQADKLKAFLLLARYKIMSQVLSEDINRTKVDTPPIKYETYDFNGSKSDQTPGRFRLELKLPNIKF